MKDKIIRIRADQDFTDKVEYLQEINGYKNKSETIRKVVDKDYRKETHTANKGIWHTGKPKEEGVYLCAVKHYTRDLKAYFIYHTLDYNKEYGFPMDVKAWQRIEPYEEETK